MVAWGSRDFGGDAAAVQGMLYNVQMIQSSRDAFAALRDWVDFRSTWSIEQKKTPNKWDTILYHRCILTDFMKGIIQMVIFWDTNHSVGLSERGLYRNKMFCMNSEHDD